MPDIELEGYELITLVAKKQIPVGTTITVMFKDTFYEMDEKLIVESDGDDYYLIWEDGSEVGNSLFTDSLFYYTLKIRQ